MSGPSELVAALGVFKDASTQLGLASTAPRYVGWRLGATANDVVSSVEVLLGAHERAGEAFASYKALPSSASEETRLEQVFGPYMHLITAFKSVHIWLRSFQDAACGILIEVLGGTAGRYRSMSKELKRQEGAVGSLLDEVLPEYRDWFAHHKTQRDEMKTGAQFVVHVQPSLHSISFAYPTDEGGTRIEEREISLAEVATGLEMSARLADAIRARMLELTAT